MKKLPRTRINKKRLFNRLGKYFSDARNAAGLTQGEAAAKFGFTTPQHISNIERGLTSPNPQLVRKFIKVYGLDEARVIEDILDIQMEYLRAELAGTAVPGKQSR